MQKNKLIIFVKNEEAGNVKTRLAASVGDERALQIYQKLLAYTADIIAPVDAEKEVWYSRFIPEKNTWRKAGVQQQIQEGNDLGMRMSFAFKNTFEEGAERVVIIGSDCAELTSDIISNAFEKLHSKDFVVGPAKDGGYYLLGMRDFHPSVFEHISWSTATVLEHTIANIKKLNKSYHLLPALNDVDTLNDWEQVQHKL